jgi:predicted nucleic acid-binding protein
MDTNVILDFILSREPHIKEAVILFDFISQDRIEAYTTANSIADIYYITAKRLGDKQARSVLYDLLNIFEIISVDGIDCSKALSLPITDFEDALAATCASKENIEYIVTNDKIFLKIASPLIHIIKTTEMLGIINNNL